MLFSLVMIHNGKCESVNPSISKKENKILQVFHSDLWIGGRAADDGRRDEILKKEGMAIHTKCVRVHALLVPHKHDRTNNGRTTASTYFARIGG
jgi:hypothetical protein